MAFKDGFEMIARDRDINNGPCLRVLLFMLSQADAQDRVLLSCGQIARELDMARSNVSLALKKLVKKEVLAIDHVVGRERTYKLTKAYFHGGRPGKLE